MYRWIGACNLGGLILMAIAVLGILLFKAATKKKQPGRDALNKALIQAARIWNEADTKHRLTTLMIAGVGPDNPAFNHTVLLTEFDRLDQNLQFKIMGVVEGIRMGVIQLNTDESEGRL